jgi:hypothetical protein
VNVKTRTIFVLLSLFTWMPQSAPAQTAMLLTVEKGFPLRVALSAKLRYKENEPVKAQLLEPVFSFDREVIPSGTEVTGRITGFQRPAKWRRRLAVLSGDFTPLREPEITFDMLVLKEGRQLAIRTAVQAGTDRLVQFGSADNQKKKGKIATAVATAKAQITAREREAISTVKSPGRMERLKTFLWGFAPYHPQYVPVGTHFKATLQAPLDFGSATLAADSLNEVGAALPPDTVASARLMTNLSSDTTKHGTAVEALLTRPMLDTNQRVVFPVGSMLHGTVIESRPARRWHRSGQLAFMFTKVEPPPSLAAKASAQEIDGRLDSVGVDSASMGKVQFDDEGGLSTPQSNKRFVLPAVSALLAIHSADGAERPHYNRNGEFDPGGPNNAYGSRIAGGGIGFGLLGSVLGRVSRPFGVALGFYGASRSIYLNVISPGPEMKFPVDTPIEIRFGRP